MYAVVTTGGKQYRVEAGSELVIEKLAAEAGASVTFDRVLLVGDGDDVTVGTPLVSGATVTGTVLREERGPKIVIFKFKQKAKYRRRTGHRQDLMRVRIDEISASGKSSKAEAAPKPKAKATPKAAASSTGEKAADKPKATATAKPKPKAKAAAKAGAKPKAKAAAAEKPKRATRAKATDTTTDKPKRATRSRKPAADKE